MHVSRPLLGAAPLRISLPMFYFVIFTRQRRSSPPYMYPRHILAHATGVQGMMSMLEAVPRNASVSPAMAEDGTLPGCRCPRNGLTLVASAN